MRKGWIIALLVVATTFGIAATAPGDAGQDPLEKRVVALERKVRAQQEVMNQQEETLKDLNSQIKAYDGWFQALPGKVKALEQAVDHSRLLGFTAAGANPRAKETLLSAVSSFGRGLAMGIPKPDQTKNGKR